MLAKEHNCKVAVTHKRTHELWIAIYCSVQTGPGSHPASCTMATGSFPGVKSVRGATVTPHPLLVPWSRKSRAIPILPLWAVRPVQSLSACTRVHFTFYLFLSVAGFPKHFCSRTPFSFEKWRRTLTSLLTYIQSIGWWVSKIKNVYLGTDFRY